ncbi:2-oxo-4-hydroxy-4-carboxy-5-ureidoimidazoline decarboxylase [Azoarcus sp. L1K30]|uniref:2-oxo-4-hydroxy-4-carboxy-5-ureidoimidazoline decarboxylase n=1 Tax=Azoarcus sp. L1K30 TaxID=2820277 RepID=UPI001B844C52|nr:2-oxo-4-hydroxy-4-carboxy-5-ureidoimidazoline decarboxylase [Azoarcus sp. L1K30]MBR0567300.1 2-oxo-4-hydroxy-4-carboxy-5-ureidoimidazoline decarboxylase [Azoarcus sp. L1K30]
MHQTDARPLPSSLALEQINALPAAGFVAVLGEVVEHSPWVVERAAAARPFASVWSLHAALQAAMHAATLDERLHLLRGHPELAGREALAGEMTDDSSLEQARLGLTRLQAAELARLTELNRAYRERFGYPFITALRLHPDLVSIFDEMTRRLDNPPTVEMGIALAQIGEVVRGRLAKRFGIACGWLSTHVLDTVSGQAACGVGYDLLGQDGDAWRLLGSGSTNAAGRTDQPILVDAAMRAGTYQLEFKVGDYFRRQHGGASTADFLDVVPVRFVIGAPDRHYHVPLVCTPFSYSTYRGS